MTSVGQSFSQREIFFTGANGFLGKVILGLLLDRVSEFERLHILMRPRTGLSGGERFQTEVLGSPPLAAIGARRGGDFLREKIHVIAGELSAPGCGLADDEVADLAGRVSLIINCAGRVDFFPPLDDSLGSNVDGVESVIALARRWDAKLLHVSTGFVCGESDGLIEESAPVRGHYPHRRGPSDASFDCDQELRHAREMVRQIYESDGGDPHRRSRELAQRLTALGKQRAADWGWVNTYTYAKSLGEQIIASTPDLDYAIVRPAIVESAWQFPFPGWIEGGRTAAPLVLMALGGQKDWPVREDAPLEVIPVDMVAAAILVVAALLLDGRHAPVYQLASADVNPVDLGSIVRWLDAEARSRTKSGLADGSALAAWLAGARRRQKVHFVSEHEAEIRRGERERRAARAERGLARLAGRLQKARMPGARPLTEISGALRKLSLQSKFREQTLDHYLPFVLQNRYIFECENIREAFSTLSEADRKLLPWRPEIIDWKDYWINNQVAGIEKWVQPEVVRDWAFKI